MSVRDIAEHDPLQCTCFDCLHSAGYGYDPQPKATCSMPTCEREAQYYCACCKRMFCLYDIVGMVGDFRKVGICRPCLEICQGRACDDPAVTYED